MGIPSSLTFYCLENCVQHYQFSLFVMKDLHYFRKTPQKPSTDTSQLLLHYFTVPPTHKDGKSQGNKKYVSVKKF